MKYCLPGLVFASFAAPAVACTVPTPPIYDATLRPSDVVIEGIATSAEQSSGEPFADIKITNVYVGKFPATAYRLKWWNYDGSGMCEPPGPAVRAGEHVRIYLRRNGRGYEPQGWVLANKNPKSQSAIQQEQAVAQRREHRQQSYFNAGGALSYNDPKQWLRIEDIPELRHSNGMVLVSFTVSPKGTMEDCTPGHVAKYVTLDRKACKIIQRRAKLVPPVFEEEASGSFEMYPPEDS